jgi:surface antigen
MPSAASPAKEIVMLEKLIAFIAQYLGAKGTGTTAQNAGQCVGLIERWLGVLGVGPIWGNAADLMKNADPRYYTVVPNRPDNYPPAGAVVCWGTTWGTGYGHTAVVIAATASALAVFEQNDPLGRYPSVATHDYDGVMGWIIVKVGK